MAQSEVSVELRLKLSKLAQDAAKAGGEIDKGLASSVKGLPKTASEREDQAAAALAYRRMVERRRANAAIEARYEANRPKPPVLPKATLVPPGQKLPIASLLAGVGLGVPGLGAIAGLASINPVLAAAVGSFRILTFSARLVSNEFHRAAEEARRLYAKTLTSGFSTQFTAHRSLLAQTIGVGENEVLQFGAAVNVLSGRLELASKTIASTNNALTASAWNFKVLEADIGALRSKVAYELAPAFNLLSGALDSIVKKMIEHSSTLLNIVGGSAIKTVLFQTPIIAEVLAAASPAIAAIIKGAGAQAAPPPVGFMKQMPASQWEHMGLVIGSGGGVNYGKNTAENTKKASELLASLPAEIAKAFRQYAAHNANFSLPALP